MDPRRPLTVGGLADELLTAPPLLGGTRLVCIDGPAGSGRTTSAGLLAGALGETAEVVHMDDVYARRRADLRIDGTAAGSRDAPGLLD